MTDREEKRTGPMSGSGLPYKHVEKDILPDHWPLEKPRGKPPPQTLRIPVSFKPSNPHTRPSAHNNSDQENNEPLFTQFWDETVELRTTWDLGGIPISNSNHCQQLTLVPLSSPENNSITFLLTESQHPVGPVTGPPPEHRNQGKLSAALRRGFKAFFERYGITSAHLSGDNLDEEKISSSTDLK